MRRALLVIVGALVLQLGLLSTALADVPPVHNPTTSTEPTTPPTEPTTPPTEPTEPTTPPTEPTTPPTEPTTPPTEPTTPPTEPTTPPTRPEPGEGRLRISPTSGPVGTVISVRSVTPSPLEGEQFVTVLLFRADFEGAPVNLVTLEVNQDGSWSGSLPVSERDLEGRTTRPGAYAVVAGVENESGDLFFYAPAAFEVTPAPNRPPLGGGGQAGEQPSETPVVTTPSVTG